jgi:winged helix DNA-binding protein
VLARQLLLERSAATPPRALERVGGLQAQHAPSMYIGLWTRLVNFRRTDLTRALERRTVVQGTLMRATIHLTAARDYWPLALAIRRGRRERWLRGRRGQPSARELAAAAGRLRRQLEDGPLTRAKVDEILDGSSVLRNGVGLWLDLVRVPPSGTWEQRRADLYAAAQDWLGPAEVSAQEGIDHLVRRYLGAFGPAPVGDIADWAGLPKKAVAQACKRARLRSHEGEGGTELLDLPRAPLPDPETPAPVRFLPVWDASLLVHARRTGIVPEQHRPRIFNTKTPHSMPTFLVDGTVAGTWRHERGRVRIEPFGRLDKRTRSELKAEADRLAEFHR